jgi:hypothetical protein
MTMNKWLFAEIPNVDFSARRTTTGYAARDEIMKFICPSYLNVSLRLAKKIV